LWLIESQGLGENYFRKLFKAIENVNKKDCVKMTQETLNPDTLAIVVAGDAEKLKESLAEIAPVKVIEPAPAEEK
jgi:predicted Zn-dependent peptidase